MHAWGSPKKSDYSKNSKKKRLPQEVLLICQMAKWKLKTRSPNPFRKQEKTNYRINMIYPFISNVARGRKEPTYF